MRRASSLLVVAGSLVLVASQSSLTLSSIKALDTTATDKDQWNFKGRVDGADNDYVLAVGELGIVADLEDSEFNTLDSVAFTPEQCKLLSNEKGFTCRTKGARLSAKKAVSKEANVVGKSDNKTSTFTYYKVSGSFHRRDFPGGPQLMPLTARFSVGGDEIDTTNTDCTTKELVSSKTRYHCVPGDLPITSAPSSAPSKQPTNNPIPPPPPPP